MYTNHAARAFTGRVYRRTPARGGERGPRADAMSTIGPWATLACLGHFAAMSEPVSSLALERRHRTFWPRGLRPWVRLARAVRDYPSSSPTAAGVAGAAAKSLRYILISVRNS